MIPNLKETVLTKDAHCSILNENLTVIEDFNLSPFDEKDKAEISEHLNYLIEICNTYLKFADGFDPEEDK